MTRKKGLISRKKLALFIGLAPRARHSAKLVTVPFWLLDAIRVEHGVEQTSNLHPFPDGKKPSVRQACRYETSQLQYLLAENYEPRAFVISSAAL
jgi:hypothetical protein